MLRPDLLRPDAERRGEGCRSRCEELPPTQYRNLLELPPFATPSKHRGAYFTRSDADAAGRAFAGERTGAVSDGSGRGHNADLSAPTMHTHPAMAELADRDGLIAASRHAIADSRVCVQRATATAERAERRLERGRTLFQAHWLQRELMRRRLAGRSDERLRSRSPLVGRRVVWKSLADIVRAKVERGVLPLETPPKLWVGIGRGEVCTACEKPILPAQSEYEVEHGDGRAPIRLHIGCHGLWQAELRRRGHPIR